jgi:uncharacterized protein YndB with AHSA1/START domain
MHTDLKTHDNVITRVLDAPVEAVWQAWVDPDVVMQWWGPGLFTGILAKMDVREGGTSLVGMRAPDDFGGQDYYNTWTYTRIVPHERIDYVLRFTDRDGRPLGPAELDRPAGVPPEVRMSNCFRRLGSRQTEMTVTERGFTTAEAAALSRQGLELCLDKMAALLTAARR